MQYPPIALVHQALEYQDGSLYWRNRPLEHFANERSWKIWNTRFSGEEAGWPVFYKHENRCRWVVKLDGKVIYRSILVWALNNQAWPTLEIGHRDRNTLNDKIENLRPATRSQHKANNTKYSVNTSGYKGVWWNSDTGRWRALIGVNGKSIYLGYFDTPEEAYAEYCAAAIKHHGEFARLV
jgi:hypothetical protein